MYRQKQTRFYNILLPLWLLLFWPTWLWLLLIPANYLLDRIVLKWSLGDMPEKGAFCRKHNWKICLAGFFSDAVGVALLLAFFLISANVDEASSLRDFFEKLGYGVGFNPFSNLWGFLIVAAAVALAAFLIYVIDKAILKKAGLDVAQAKKSALRLALITAPYLYFFPSALLYDLSTFTS